MRRLNARFARGAPSNDPSSVGVFVRALDGMNYHGGTAWAGHTYESGAGDRISGSIINRKLPFMWIGDAFWHHPHGPTATFVVRPDVAADALLWQELVCRTPRCGCIDTCPHVNSPTAVCDLVRDAKAQVALTLVRAPHGRR